MSHPSPGPEQREREAELRRELESLGEPPPSDDELALILDQQRDDDSRDLDVATVSRLVELASASGSTMPLSELELHRGWRTIEQRAAAQSGPELSREGREDKSGRELSREGREDKSGPTRRRWLFVGVGSLAAAAGVLFVVLGPERKPIDDGAQGPSLEQVQTMSEQVHATLRALDDGKSDTQRAAEIAADYERRLKQRQEQDG
jgi:hypothetical protein